MPETSRMLKHYSMLVSDPVARDDKTRQPAGRNEACKGLPEDSTMACNCANHGSSVFSKPGHAFFQRPISLNGELAHLADAAGGSILQLQTIFPDFHQRAHTASLNISQSVLTP